VRSIYCDQSAVHRLTRDLWEIGLFRSPPDFSLPPTPSPERRGLGVVGNSGVPPPRPIRGTLDDVHEDIKRSYGVFLSMLDDGLFDAARPSSPLEHINPIDQPTFFDSTADSTWIRDLAQPESALDLDGVGFKETNSRIISMLIRDLKSQTWGITKQQNSSRIPQQSISLPRSQNPLMVPLGDRDNPMIRLDELGLSPRSDASPSPMMTPLHVTPSVVFSSGTASPEMSPFSPRHDLVTRPTNTYIAQGGLKQKEVSRAAAASQQHPMVAPRPADRCYLHQFDFDSHENQGSFGFGREVNQGTSRIQHHVERRPPPSPYENPFQDCVNRPPLGTYVRVPAAALLPPRSLAYSKSLPEIYGEGRLRTVMPSRLALHHGTGPTA